MGSAKGLELVRNTDNIECIIVLNDNKILLSDGMENFILTSKDYILAEE